MLSVKTIIFELIHLDFLSLNLKITTWTPTTFMLAGIYFGKPEFLLQQVECLKFMFLFVNIWENFKLNFSS